MIIPVPTRPANTAVNPFLHFLNQKMKRSDCAFETIFQISHFHNSYEFYLEAFETPHQNSLEYIVFFDH